MRKFQKKEILNAVTHIQNSQHKTSWTQAMPCTLALGQACQKINMLSLLWMHAEMIQQSHKTLLDTLKCILSAKEKRSKMLNCLKSQNWIATCFPLWTKCHLDKYKCGKEREKGIKMTFREESWVDVWLRNRQADRQVYLLNNHYLDGWRPFFGKFLELQKTTEMS